MSAPALPRMRLVYFVSIGSEIANPLLEMFAALGQEVLLVVTTPGPLTRPMTGYKDIVAHIDRRYDVLVTTHIKRLAALLRPLDPDLIFVSGFPWRLPAELLTLPRLGSINMHPTLLPRYRGPDPFFWMMMNGETEMGLTIHRMDGDFDTGPILAQAGVTVGPDADFAEMVQHFGPLLRALVPQALAAAGRAPPRRPQPTEGASYARLRTPADRPLDWTRPAAALRNQVRAWDPAGALATLDGQEWVVTRARVVADTVVRPAVPPGTVVSRGPEGVLVQTGDGLLLLSALAPAS